MYIAARLFLPKTALLLLLSLFSAGAWAVTSVTKIQDQGCGGPFSGTIFHTVLTCSISGTTISCTQTTTGGCASVYDPSASASSANPLTNVWFPTTGMGYPTDYVCADDTAGTVGLCWSLNYTGSADTLRMTMSVNNDIDNDGALNSSDNCYAVSNADQLNADGDAQGNACDTDDDNDGVLDTTDSFPLDVTRSAGNTNILYTFNGDSAGDEFGISVSGAGDVNNDGYADVIVGAYADDNNGSNSGSVQVLSGANGAILYTFNGDSASDNFGESVSGAGDVNNDGYADVIVGAVDDDNNGMDSGSARVLSGANGANGAILYTFNGDSVSDGFGESVSGAGDVNNDGYADVVVGTYVDDNNGSNSGSARVLSGANGTILYTFNGDSASDFFGYSVSGAGDMNNDGYADVIVGAYVDDNNGSSSGSARVLSGKGLWTDTGGDGQNDAVDADDDNDGVLDINDATPRGNGLDTDGDGTIDGFDTDDDNDSVADIADPFPLDANRWLRSRHNADLDNDSDVLVRSISTGAWTSYGVQNGAVIDFASYSIPTSSDTQYIAQLDANGDGDADVLTRSVSTGAWTLHQIQSGAVISSAPLYLYANLDWKFVGAGDLNGDGTDDVLLRSTSQSYYNSFLINNHAVATVHSYNAWPDASSVDQGIGDFDGDGTDDLLVRRTSDNLYFIFKSVNGLVDSSYCACNVWRNPDWVFQFAGDTNKDGIDDIVIRATGATGDGFWWAFRMNNFMSTQVTNLNLFKDKTRVSLGAVGDYNGDGTVDVLTRVDGATTYVSPITNGLVTGNNWLQNFTADQTIQK